MADAIVIPIIGKDQATAALKAVRGQVVGLGDDAKQTDGLLSKLGGALANLGGFVLKAGLAAATAAFVGFGAVLASGVQDARAHALVMAQTEQTITSMGNAAGVSAKHVEDFAASLSAAEGKSLFGDDQIQAATNMLLTFGNIKGATLDLATTLTVDMAQALKKTPEDMSIMVGKILNSADAMSAAQRQGVSFSDAQLALGKRLFETGRIAEYQDLVLGELNKEFGGQAEAAAKADGGWAQLQDRWGEAKETLGTAVLPLLNTLVGTLNDSVMPVIEGAAARFGDLVAAFQTGAEGGDFLGGIVNTLYALDDVSPVFDTIADGIVSLAQSFDEGGIGGFLNDLIYQLTGIQGVGFQVVDAVNAVSEAFQPLIATFTDAETPIQGLIAVLSEVSPAFALLYGVASEIFPQLRALILEIFGDISAYFQENGAGMLAEAQTTWQSIHDTILSLVQPLAEVISAVLTQIAIFWQAHDDEIMAFVGTTWTQINSIIQVAMQLIQATIIPLLQGIAAFISAHGEEIQQVFSGAWQIISSVIDAALTLIKGILTAALQAIQGDWSGAWQTIQDMSARIVADILGVIQGGLDLIEGSFNASIDAIIAIWQGLVGDAAGIGNDIVMGILNGVKGAANQLLGYMQSLATDALNAAKNVLNMHSPSQEFAEVGEDSVIGWIQGARRLRDQLLGTFADMGAKTVDAAAGVAQDVSGAITDSSLPDDAVEFGHYVMEGFIDGVQDKVDDALDVINDIGERLQQGFNDALELGSPPDWATDAGSFVMQGLLEGLEDGLPDLLGALEQMGGVLQAQMGEISAQLSGKLTDEARKALEAQRDGLQETIDAIADTVGELPDKIHSALADAFDASADIDRQQMKNIDAVRRLASNFQAETQAALDQALTEAQKIQDPEQAAKFFQQQSNQILELAKLTDAYYAAINSGDTEHAADLERQIALAKDAQANEQRAFGERSQIAQGGALGDLHDVLEQITNTVTDPGSGPLHDLLAWLYDLQVRTDAATSGAGVPPQQMAAPGAPAAALGGAPVSIIVNAAPGMNEQMIADMVMREIERRYQGRL